MGHSSMYAYFVHSKISHNVIPEMIMGTSLAVYSTLKCSNQDKPAALTSYEHLGKQLCSNSMKEKVECIPLHPPPSLVVSIRGKS